MMRKTATFIISASVVAVLMITLAAVPQSLVAAEPSMIEKGKSIAENRKKGNCIACHLIQGAVQPGDIGPPLIGMKARFPDKSVLRAQIWDSTKSNPNSMMPPFGRHEILTEKEVDLIVEYVYSL